MKLNLTFLISCVLLSLNACTRGEDQSREASAPPNIIFMISDDHAYKAISAYGYGLNRTPNIDRLAKEGAIFTRACVTNSLCAPSRAVILTGKHSFINGKVDNVQRFDWNQDNFAKRLQKAGYATALIGKIHMDGIPQGFDYTMVLPGQGQYYNPDFIVDGKTKRMEGYVTEITTELALDWLENGRDKSKPFMLMMNQKAPHRNWEPAPKYLTLFDDTTFAPPPTYFDDYSGRGSAAKSQEMEIARDARWGHDFKFQVDPEGKETEFVKQLERFTDEQRTQWNAAYGPKNQEFKNRYVRTDGPFRNDNRKEVALWKFNRLLKDYLRTVQSVDDGVGAVLNYLDKNGLSDNTIVIYVSDQGFYLGEHGWFDKRFMYEESFRTPLLMRYPKEIKAGTVIDRLVQNLDFAPTVLDFAGVEIPADMQGESFRKLVNGTSTEWREAVYYTYYEYPAEHMVKRHYGIATDRYKLMHFYYDVDEWEMYDRKEDPNEMRNVYNDSAYAGVKAELRTKLSELRKKYGDSDEFDKHYLDAYLEHQKQRAKGK